MPHLHSWLFGLAVLTVLAVGVPVMLWAQSNDAPHRVNVDAGALSNLQMKMNELQKAMDGLMASKSEPGEVPMGFVSKPDDGRADCLNTCRMEQANCMENFEGQVEAGELHPCLTESNACITSCNDAPRSPISCQDRCAVAMGGCVERVVAPKQMAVSDEMAVLDECRMKNVECLVNACKLTGEQTMPDTYCADQCRRMHVICTTGSSQYDTNTMELCDRLQQTCEQRLCARVGLLPNVKIMQGEQGEYLADGDGRALYVFSDDAMGKSMCTGDCLNNWPIFHEEDLMVASGLDKSFFGSVLREDGKMQLTYRGWPLYYYSGDTIIGDIKGHGRNSEKWMLANHYMNPLTQEQCEYACRDMFEECKRSDEMPYTCQEKLDNCNNDCLNLESND